MTTTTLDEYINQCRNERDTDRVSSPQHYTWHPAAECKTVVQEFSYNIGTAMAYLWRHEHKGTAEEDLQKAIKHIQFELERIQSE